MKLLCTTLVVIVVVVVVVARVSRRLLFCQLDSHKKVEQQKTYPVLPGLSVVGQIAPPSGIVPTVVGVRPIRIRRIRRTTRLLVGSLTASFSSSPSVPTRGLEEVSFVPQRAGQKESDSYILVAIHATLEAS